MVRAALIGFAGWAMIGCPQISSAAVTAPPTGKITVAYYRGANSSSLPVTSIPAAALSHVIYVGATVGASDVCVFKDPTNDPGKVIALNTTVKEAHSGLKTSIVIQGDAGLTRVAGDATKRASFAAACAQFMVANGFDGLDVDWEYPNDATEGATYTLLMAALRSALDAKEAETGGTYYLTMAGPATWWEYEKLQLGQLKQYVDWFNLLTYDFHGPWSANTGHNAPLYPMSLSGQDSLTCNAGVQAYLDAQVPASQLVLGVPFYAYEWYQVYNEPNNNGYARQSQTTNGNGYAYGGSYTFRGLLNAGKITLNSSVYPADSVAGASSGLHMFSWGYSEVQWLFPSSPATTGNFISYDDPQSMGDKGKFVTLKSLRGAMIWAIDQDTSDFLLLDALNWGMSQ